MSSFTTNMHNHITLQTQRTTIYLTVKESYTYKFPWQGTKVQLLYSLECTILQKRYEYHSVPGAFSHMSQRGTSVGSARPTRTCLLASLLHIWICSSNVNHKHNAVREKIRCKRMVLPLNYIWMLSLETLDKRHKSVDLSNYYTIQSKI